MGQKGKNRTHPNWCDEVLVPLPSISREQQPWLRNLRRELTQMVATKPDQMDDPLLSWRIDNLLEDNIGQSAESLAMDELKALQQARHAIAHEGKQMEEEYRARKLAALGIEVLCAVYEHHL